MRTAQACAINVNDLMRKPVVTVAPEDTSDRNENWGSSLRPNDALTQQRAISSSRNECP